MNEKLKEKISEAFSSVLPITVIVLLISTILVPMSVGTMALFIVGAVLLVVGMGFFALGAEMSMTPIGEGVGVELTKSKKLLIAISACFLLGFIITIAEPDLQVLATQVSSVPSMLLIMSVAVGVGFFLVVAMLRVLFGIALSRMLLVFYLIVIVISIFTPSNFISVAFDSGGVTTGPVTVPFILALGAGIAGVRGDKDSLDDSFGFVALCSVGPILAVMILGTFYNPDQTSHAAVMIPEVETLRDVIGQFAHHLPDYLKEMAIAIIPIFAFFIIFQMVFRRYKKLQIARIVIGLVYTLIGLVLFLTGVNVGFIPVGSLLGSELAGSPFKWLLVPIGMVIGYFIVAAEPAVHVLNKQVEEISEGSISQKAMNLCLSLGVAISVGLSVIRVLTGISIYWLIIPGYTIALLLTRKVPKIFTGIAFDSGGVASGPMTTTFLLPFVLGACEAVGGDVMADAFGVVAMVAMTPLIAIQVLGYIYKDKMQKSASVVEENIEMDEIMEMYEQEDGYEPEVFGRR